MAVVSRPSVEIERPETNDRIELIAEPVFISTDSRASIPRSPMGGKGIYRATFALAVPGKEAFRDELDVERLLNSGESLLQVSKDLGGLKVDIAANEGTAAVHFYPNATGTLAKAVTRVNASNFRDAEVRAHNVVLPILSWWSYYFDVAIDVGACEIFEERTDVTKWSVPVLGRRKAFKLDSPGFYSKVEHRFLLAAYREANGASNVFYQFLSYYKVIEGVRRLRTANRHGSHPERLPDTVEDLPMKDELVLDSFKPYLGKSYGAVADDFRKLVRNAVAHLNPFDGSLMADNLEDLHKCSAAMPVVKHIAREMLGHLLADESNAG